MRRIILALAASLAVLIAGTLPASAAYPVWNWRFWTGDICMTVGDTGIEAGAIAAKWNAQSGGKLNIHSANNCATSYPPSRRFTIDTTNDGPNKWCIKVTDINGGTLYPNTADGQLGDDGWVRYSNNPRVWLNIACPDWPVYWRHYVSAGIGQILGLSQTNSSGYNSRVMNMTNYSIVNIPYPDANSGGVLKVVYGNGCQYTTEC